MNEEFSDDKRSPYNAGDAAQVAHRQKGRKTRELRKKSGLRKLMSDPEGRMWVWDLLIMTGFSRASFSTDPLTMAFNEGRRNIGLQIIGEINALSPELYVKMALENEDKGEG